jgi:hypothetical protein
MLQVYKEEKRLKIFNLNKQLELSVINFGIMPSLILKAFAKSTMSITLKNKWMNSTCSSMFSVLSQKNSK